MAETTIVRIDENGRMDVVRHHGVELEGLKAQEAQNAGIKMMASANRSILEIDDWKLKHHDGSVEITWKDQLTGVCPLGRSGLIILQTPESQANQNVVRGGLFGEHGSGHRDIIHVAFVADKDAAAKTAPAEASA